MHLVLFTLNVTLSAGVLLHYAEHPWQFRLAKALVVVAVLAVFYVDFFRTSPVSQWFMGG